MCDAITQDFPICRTDLSHARRFHIHTQCQARANMMAITQSPNGELMKEERKNLWHAIPSLSDDFPVRVGGGKVCGEKLWANSLSLSEQSAGETKYAIINFDHQLLTATHPPPPFAYPASAIPLFLMVQKNQAGKIAAPRVILDATYHAPNQPSRNGSGWIVWHSHRLGLVLASFWAISMTVK